MIFRLSVLRCMPEQVGGLAQVAVGLGEHVGDELLLELALGVVVAHALRHHLVDQTFELFFSASNDALELARFRSVPVRRR